MLHYYKPYINDSHFRVKLSVSTQLLSVLTLNIMAFTMIKRHHSPQRIMEIEGEDC